ncbi:MAG: CdaR family protein [Polyangia bacterium]
MRRIAGRAVTENLGLKLVALVVAVTLFTLVRFQEKVERWVDVEVNVRRPPASSGVVLTSDTPDTLRVSLRGRRSLVREVKQGERPQVVMDMSENTEAGSFTYFFEPKMFDFPSSVEVVDINPQSVIVRTEKLVTRKVPVRAKTTGRLQPGTELAEEPEVRPSEVTVAGPASLMRAINEVHTAHVDVEGLGAGEHETQVPLHRREGLEYRVSGDIDVTLRVRWRPGQRMLSGLLVRVEGEADVAEIKPGEVAVSLVGAQVKLDRLDPGEVVPKVEIAAEDLSGGEPLRVDVEVEGLPEGIAVKSIVPATVQVVPEKGEQRPRVRKAAGGAP